MSHGPTREESRQACCARYALHDARRNISEQSHDAACDWLDENPFPCGGNAQLHMERCKEAVSTRCGFFDPGSLYLIYQVLSTLWMLWGWLSSDEDE